MAVVEDYRIELDSSAGVPCGAVSLSLRSAHSRRIEADIEASIEVEWQSKLQKHPRMFNGSKFRYGSAAADGSGGVCFELALTDYRSMVGTNMTARHSELAARDPRLLANAVGNGAVVETADRCVMLLLRSPDMLEAPNTYVFPGGHPEPKSCGLDAWGAAELVAHERAAAAAAAAAAATGASAADAVERRVRDELFASLRREVVEELGCHADDLCAAGQALLGVTVRLDNSRHTMAFVMGCAATSEQILARYRAGHAEDSFESSRLLAVPIAELKERAATLPMPGCHRGVLELYLRHLAARATAEGAKL